MSACKWCDLGWELGRFGCHYEPMPTDWADDEFMGRMRTDCQNWAEKRKEFYGEGKTLQIVRGV